MGLTACAWRDLLSLHELVLKSETKKAKKKLRRKTFSGKNGHLLDEFLPASYSSINNSAQKP
jgi:hypothetical protein